jgi:hypothetical protein
MLDTFPTLLEFSAANQDVAVVSIISSGHSRGRCSGKLQGPVIIAMITVRMVQPAVYEIVDMITMRHLFMPAVWTVCV